MRYYLLDWKMFYSPEVLVPLIIVALILIGLYVLDELAYKYHWWNR